MAQLQLLTSSFPLSGLSHLPWMQCETAKTSFIFSHSAPDADRGSVAPELGGVFATFKRERKDVLRNEKACGFTPRDGA